MKGLNIFCGILMILAGILFITHPFASMMFLGCFLGISMLLGGISSLASGTGDNRSVWDILLGIVSIIAGGFVIFNYAGRLMALNVVVIFLAVLILITGFTRIMMAFELRKADHSGWGFVLAAGILSIILAVMLFANPFTGMLVIETVFAVTVIMQGVVYISAAAAQ